MSGIDDLAFPWVALIAFVPMFVLTSFIRARGIGGVLALAGALAFGAVLVAYLHGVRLAVGGICVLIGITLGGRVSDHLERKRLTRLWHNKRRYRTLYEKGGVAQSE